MDLEKIYSYIDANRDRYIELLQSFVRQPSVASMHPENEQMKELVMKTVREYTGAEPEEIKTPGNSVLYTEIPGKRKDRTLGIYNHYDVVSAGDESEWKYPPYSGTIEDGKILYSRGAADNKDALACRLCALEAIRAVGEELPLNIKMVYDGEEEVGSPSLSKVVADNPSKFHADGYMWEGGDRLPDNGPLIIALGAKGMLSVELFAKGGNIDIHSANAPLVENPAWRLVWALASIKDANDKILIDGFYDDVEPVTQEELDSLKMGHFDPDDAKRLSGVKEYIGGVEGDEALKKLLFAPTANIDGMVSGHTGTEHKSLVPARASVKMDFRLVAGQDPAKIEKLLRKHLDDHGFSDIEMVVESGCAPFRSDINSTYVKALMEAATDVYGAEPAVQITLAGTSPMEKICKYDNIPVAMIGPGNTESAVHSPNEHIFIEDYILGIKMVVATIEKFAKAE